MKYKVLIKKCDNPKRAARIAEEIAKRSGSTPDVVLAVIMEKSVCIKKDADENEAMRLKEEFEAAGAEVEFVPLAVPGAQSSAPKGEDDDTDDPEGRTLTEAEYVAKLKERRDIFTVDRDHRLRNIEVLLLALGIVLGVWITKHEMIQVASDFYEKIPEQVSAKLLKGEELPEPCNRKKKTKKRKKRLKPIKRRLSLQRPRAPVVNVRRWR